MGLLKVERPIDESIEWEVVGGVPDSIGARSVIVLYGKNKEGDPACIVGFPYNTQSAPNVKNYVDACGRIDTLDAEVIATVIIRSADIRDVRNLFLEQIRKLFYMPD